MTNREKIELLEKQDSRNKKKVILISIVGGLSTIGLIIFIFLFLVAKDGYKKVTYRNVQLQQSVDYYKGAKQLAVDSTVYYTKKKSTKESVKVIKDKEDEDIKKLETITTSTPDIAIELWQEYMSIYLPNEQHMVQTNN